MSIPRNLGNFADNVNTNGKVEVTGINATGTPSASTALLGNGTWGTVTTSPAGSNTQIQYNNSGAFGASSNLTFDGTNLGVGVTPSTAAGYTTFDLSNATNGGRFRLLVGSTPYGIFYTNGITDVRLMTAASVPLLFGTNYNEYLRIAPSGAFGLSGTNYGSSGQILTSQGSGSAPTWVTPAGGAGAFVAFGSTGGF